MNAVIELTDAACEHIQKIIEKNNAKAFRLSVKNAGCNGLRYLPEVVDVPQAGDLELDVNSHLQVFVAADSVQYLKDTTVDVLTKELNQKQLVFKNPNVESACGCGESFNVKENENNA